MSSGKWSIGEAETRVITLQIQLPEEPSYYPKGGGQINQSLPTSLLLQFVSLNKCLPTITMNH